MGPAGAAEMLAWQRRAARYPLTPDGGNRAGSTFHGLFCRRIGG